jgi:hypothetical protein
MSAKEYRDYAAESMDWAKTASSDQERVTFLDMAKTWLQAAAIAERQSSSGNGRLIPYPAARLSLSHKAFNPIRSAISKRGAHVPAATNCPTV